MLLAIATSQWVAGIALFLGLGGSLGIGVWFINWDLRKSETARLKVQPTLKVVADPEADILPTTLVNLETEAS